MNFPREEVICYATDKLASAKTNLSESVHFSSS